MAKSKFFNRKIASIGFVLAAGTLFAGTAVKAFYDIRDFFNVSCTSYSGKDSQSRTLGDIIRDIRCGRGNFLPAPKDDHSLKL
jgi:hypothetical protein